MHFQRENLPAEAREKITALMNAKGWSFEQAINEIAIVGVANGATSAVGRNKAPVLHLVPLNRDSGRG